MAGAVSGILPLEDKAIVMRVLSLFVNPSLSRSGPTISTPIRKVSGLRRHCQGRFVRRRQRRTRDPWPGRGLCMSPYVFAAVMARSRRLLSVLRPMALSMPTQ
jgi:hypothetical protein